MRKLAIVMALASTAIASPALSRDDSWYIGVDAGASIVEDGKIAISNATTGALVGTGATDNEYGYDVDGVIGYDFGGFRLEAEVGYKASNLDQYASTTTTAAANAAGALFAVPAGSFDYAGGRTSALSFMLNGLLDFGEDDGLQGFVGGGVGIARTKLGYSLSTRAISFLDDSDTGLAWQALAGVRAPVSDHWDVGLKYRFFNASKVNLIDFNGRAND
ncbi:MAG TPA: outer membrane beta-barrel protein, partial [Chakrabartia sp.]|nr:outer membrane beta-barrel protein [Chakrabartia sp.]